MEELGPFKPRKREGVLLPACVPEYEHRLADKAIMRSRAWELNPDKFRL